MMYKRIFSVVLGLLIIEMLALPSGVMAAPQTSVSLLRGRWDGTFFALESTDRPFTLMLVDYVEDPANPNVARYNGCMALGDKSTMTPVSVLVKRINDTSFDLTMYGTTIIGNSGSTIKVTGTILIPGPGVPMETGSGTWNTSNEQGNWTAKHHDRRNFKCPPVEPGGGLYFYSSVYAIVQTMGAIDFNQGTILEGYSNIVSSGMRVTLPGGNVITIAPYSDLFSPQVDFINEFRFLGNLDGLPVSSGTYTFTLLDILGNPISGTTTTDVWHACTIDPPRNVAATVGSNGILVTWDPVAAGQGFNPGGTPSLGFYQIQFSSDSVAGIQYGANVILVSSHLIPMNSFGGNASGSPDGQDHGSALLELPDGVYSFITMAFSEAVPGSGAVGIECLIIDHNESVSFEKLGNQITILP